ncbi:hypothetical protein KNV05_gp104 [Vibrio phage River4]|uniref:Uncharacterized protein n=1 Tax=Vibrio phage River4 TaxID=2736288 RepID=A0A6M9Z1L1_9CAUD|nr:hypothetical protein KNV05_gp008 [Vibrio phage River4]YP_010108037.1 hypothetical protein KNV05_gp104 [Vibrio phage River4]QKN84670.1 hypothetical protein RIVER4_8 [Vibrio phage River4]QKN84851.1 hypothetical protein RIVER4_212 [Vibrio phage River4]
MKNVKAVTTRLELPVKSIKQVGRVIILEVRLMGEDKVIYFDENDSEITVVNTLDWATTKIMKEAFGE